MKSPQPCRGIRPGDCYRTEEEYIARRDWRSAPDPATALAQAREDHQRHVRVGIIPPRCEACGWHHKPLEARS